MLAYQEGDLLVGINDFNFIGIVGTISGSHFPMGSQTPYIGHPNTSAWSLYPLGSPYDSFAGSHYHRVGSKKRGAHRGRPLDIYAKRIDYTKYQISLESISRGDDPRTTIMLKNIPKGYTPKTLLAALDEDHRGTFDYLYMPMDIENMCNMGYAFINMVSPSDVASFFMAFDGKKWKNFQDGKVVAVSYARIQGKFTLVESYLRKEMTIEDKWRRPVLIFHSWDKEIEQVVSAVSSVSNICFLQPDGSYTGDSLDSPLDQLDEMFEQNLTIR